MTSETMEQAIAEIWELFKETDARLDQRIAETNAEVTKTSQALRKLEGLFGNQWGRLVEALVQPGILKLFQERKHDVRRLYQRSKAQLNGNTMEIDIILEDGDEVILIEVKTTLSVEDVKDFLVDLEEFTKYFPNYDAHRVLGAVAGLDVPLDVAKYAYRKGLYVVRVSGTDLVEILNEKDFTAKNFAAEA